MSRPPRRISVGDSSGEAQALLCLTDTLRVGGVDRVVEAARAASRALELFQALNLTYNVARAHHYVALTADAQGDLTSAVSHWEQSLAQARASYLAPSTSVPGGIVYSEWAPLVTVAPAALSTTLVVPPR